MANDNSNNNSTLTPRQWLSDWMSKVLAALWGEVKSAFATKTELAQNADEHLVPVSVDSLTPASTFPKNAIVGINGVLYRATAATQNLPCTLTVQDGQFVVNIVNGKTAFTVTDPAPNEGWEVFTDASVEYWINQLNALIAQKATVGDVMQATVNYGQTQFTVQQLLQEMAKLMSRTVVASA